MPPEAFYWRMVPFALAGVVLTGFLSAYRDLSVFCGCGTLAGQTMAAATWLALGPIPFRWRLPVAVFWPAVIYLVTEPYVHMGEFVGSYDLAAFLVALWTASFVLLWLVLHVTGWRLRCGDADESMNGRAAWQFRVRELLVVIAVVAVVLAVGRNIVPHFWRSTWIPITWSYWTYWLGSMLLLGLPLLCTTLRVQSGWSILLGFLLVFCGVALVEYVWHPAWIMIYNFPNPTILVGLLWITLFAVLVRNSGYRFMKLAPATP